MAYPYSHTNLAYSTLAAGIDDNDTTLDVAAAAGAKFPASNFLCVIWNVTDYDHPALDPDAEFILVTTRSTDTFSPITRGQEGSTAAAHNTGGKDYAIQHVVVASEIDSFAVGGVNRVPAGGLSIPADYSIVASEYFEIVDGQTLETGSAATLEIT